ncbi:MAG: 2-hydroxyglutaryl-CoA dehydratase [Desulfovibrio sp.]|nr:2-hydroxyglutaryl-CoA dehydratase [Desulfovibrio sp.]
MSGRVYAGIDAGSAAVKAVLVREGSREVAARAMLPTGWNPRESGEKALAMVLEQAGADSASRIVATGYGRVAFPFADRNVTEISCHAKGAVELFPACGTVIDIGGQDSKVISVKPGGTVADFVMNDKCAAGTGRFLQAVAGMLGMDVGALCALAEGEEPCAITSMCAVFAETEIVGLLARGTAPGAVAAGVLRAIARRIHALAARIPLRGECVFTGGLAASPACGRMLSQELGVEVKTPDYPQYTGALGAALVAARLR